MGSPERGRSSGKRDIEVKSDWDDGDWEASDKSKQHRSSKSRKSTNVDETEGMDSSGRRRSSGDVSENPKRSRTGSDEDSYDTRKDLRSKQEKKKQEESTLERLSSFYQDGGELENRQDGDRFSDRRKVKSHDLEVDVDSRYSERRETGREKIHGSSEHAKSSRRKWDVKKSEENHLEKVDMRSCESKHEKSKESNASARNETIDGKSRGLVASSDDHRAKGRSETIEDDKGSPASRDDRPSGEKYDRQQRTPTKREKSIDGTVTSAMEADRTNKTRTPDRSVRRQREPEQYEKDYHTSAVPKRKETEKDIYREERSKGRDDNNWTDRNREFEDSKGKWKRRPPSSGDKEAKDRDVPYDRGSRESRDRNDIDRLHGRFGNRKDGNRGEAVKTSNFSNENYDVIEIQTKPEYGRADSGSNFVKRAEVSQQLDVKPTTHDGDWQDTGDDGVRKNETYGSTEDSKERYIDEGSSMRDQNSWKGREAGPFGRAPPQGVKGARMARGRGRPNNRDNQQVGLPMPIMGSPFGPHAGSMQPLIHSMTSTPGSPISHGLFIPPFAPPIWPVGRGMDMNMLVGAPSGLSPLPLSGPRFPPNTGNQSNPAMYFNQAGPGRGVPLGIAGPGFNPAGPIDRAGPPPPDKAHGGGGWVPPRNNGPHGKAPSRGEQNDYSQNFVDTGMRPQNFIRELELTNVVEDYPKLRELIQKKDEIVANVASAPMYFKCDLQEFELSPDFFGTKFDVILVDPPWEEYVHRAPGAADNTEHWSFEEILNLKIEAIADTPSFIFLWVGDGVGLEQGRQCLKKWGFRRCEDICWVKTNKSNPTPSLRHDSHTLFQHSKEHCLMGIKGTVRRSTDGHIIHANIDTDVVIAEEPPYGSTQKPEDMYRIIEHFALGRRRIELFGEDHNIRSGWLTVGKGLSSSNFNSEAYIKNFADKEGKVWQGGGRNPPPEAPHLVLTTPDIEALRPKSPMKNQQQLQQQQLTASITILPSTRRPGGNSPQNIPSSSLNHEVSSSSCPSTPAPWTPMVEGFDGIRGRQSRNIVSEEKVFDMYAYNTPPPIGDQDF